MKRLLLTLVAMTMLLTQGAFAQEPAFTKTGKTVLLYSDGTWQYLDSIIFKARPLDIAKLEIPKTLPKDEVIAHAGYSLLYNEAHEQASWVAYELTAKETKKIYDRTDRFLVDPKVKKGSANDKDYQGSGYDRGHLAPAADMTWSIESITESFYYSNMSPQVPYFNRVIWKALEERVRSWAVENDALYIVTGPVLRKGLPTIGANRVSIPEYYYKVILDYRDPVVKGIGFIMPNMTSTVPLQAYAVSIDSVEVLTGLDFFPSLPDDQEAAIEAEISLKNWSWNTTSTYNPETRQSYSPQTVSPYKQTTESSSEKQTRSTTTSVQCSGTTQKGARCKRMTINANGRCYQH